MKSYKGHIKDNINFKPLFENLVMLIGHVFEISYCINKLTKEEFPIYQFENEPTCGLMGKNNDWCLIGGDVLILKTWIDNSLRVFGELTNIFDLRIIDDYKVHILTDPWSHNSSIWQLTINLDKLSRPTSLDKIRDFKDYISKPYSDKVDW